eukprot:g7318.t1
MSKTILSLLAFSGVCQGKLTVKYVGKEQLSAEDQFEQFKFKFNKIYESDVEHAIRFANFKASLARIESGNADRRSRGKDETLGVTKFSDLKPSEFKAMYLGRLPRRDSKPLPMLNATECPACDRFPEATNADSSSFDWVSKGAVTPVKDQGQCGSCWAFGTTGDIEGVTFLKTGKLVSLSEQELVSCDKGENEGCNGGLQEDAFDYVKKHGITTEKDYPYHSGGGSTGSCKSAKTKNDLTYIKGWTQVSKSKKGESAIKTALPKVGPITIGIDATPMQDYIGGVDSPQCNVDCGCTSSDLDHAVLMVGYGEKGSQSYWKIKNSWASDWGEDGYYRIEYGKNLCGLAFDAVHSHD